MSAFDVGQQPGIDIAVTAMQVSEAAGKLADVINSGAKFLTAEQAAEMCECVDRIHVQLAPLGVSRPLSRLLELVDPLRM